jgi:hypothetical protein
VAYTVAEDETNPSTPAPDLVYLNEAAELGVSLGHDPVVARTILQRALEMVRLREWPSEFSAKPDMWRRWFEERRVDWQKGAIYFPPGCFQRPYRLESIAVVGERWFRPQFLRQDIFDLFKIPETPPSTAAATDSTPTKRWMLVKARQLKRDGKIRERISRTAWAKQLAEESQTGAESGELKKPLTYQYILNQLDDWGVWPISSITIG